MGFRPQRPEDQQTVEEIQKTVAAMHQQEQNPPPLLPGTENSQEN